MFGKALRASRRELNNLRALPRPLVQWGGLFAGMILGSLLAGTLLIFLLGYETTRVYVLEGHGGEDCAEIGRWLESRDSLRDRFSIRPASDPGVSSMWRSDDEDQCVVTIAKRQGFFVSEDQLRPEIEQALEDRGRIYTSGAQLGNVMTLSQWALPVLALGVFLVWRRRETAHPDFQPVSTGKAMGMGLGTFFVWTLVSIPLLLLLAMLVGLENPGGQAMAEALQLDPWLIAYAVIGAPLGEELLFRRMGYRLFLNRGFPIIGALATSGAFAAIHLQYFEGTGADVVVYPTTVFVLSLLLSWLYARTGRLLAPLVAHMCVNGFAVGIAMLAARELAG